MSAANPIFVECRQTFSKLPLPPDARPADHEAVIPGPSGGSHAGARLPCICRWLVATPSHRRLIAGSLLGVATCSLVGAPRPMPLDVAALAHPARRSSSFAWGNWC